MEVDQSRGSLSFEGDGLDRDAQTVAPAPSDSLLLGIREPAYEVY